MGAGVAVAPDRVLTAHYLVLGASKAEVTGWTAARASVQRISVDHETGLALLALEGEPLRPAALVHGAGAPRPARLPPHLHGRAGARGASGHVSMVGPFEAFWEYMLDAAIMTTALNPGLAGGAALRRRRARHRHRLPRASPRWAATASPSP